MSIKTARERVTELKQRYREAGLVKLDTWTPPQHAPMILAECKRLRDEHLGRAALREDADHG